VRCLSSNALQIGNYVSEKYIRNNMEYTLKNRTCSTFAYSNAVSQMSKDVAMPCADMYAAFRLVGERLRR